jgi:hypothetical protein
MFRNGRIHNIAFINALLDHGLLLGLADDDHGHYFADTTIGTRAKNYSTSGFVSVGDGTVSAPGFAFTDDPNTGIYATEDGGGGQNINFAIDGVRTFIIDNAIFFFKDTLSTNFARLNFVGDAMTQDRDLDINLNDGGRGLNLEGNATLDDWFDQSVKTTSNPTFGNMTTGTINLLTLGRTIPGLWFITDGTVNLTVSGSGTFTIDQDLQQSATPTFAGLIISDDGFIGSVSDTDAIQIGASELVTLNADLFTDRYLNDESNTFIGIDVAGSGNLSGSTPSGRFNTAFGNVALEDITTGRNNSAFGYFTLTNLTEGFKNTVVGAGAANTLTTGNNNTIIGNEAFRGGNSSSNVIIGFEAGFNQTSASNLLIIDNQDRLSIANEVARSLVYGVFNADPANQTLKFNAAVTVLSTLTMAGLFTNTPAAGDAAVVVMDGDTNARTYAGGAETAFAFKRTFSGSDTTVPDDLILIDNFMSMDYIYTGASTSSLREVTCLRNMFNYGGDWKITSGFLNNNPVSIKALDNRLTVESTSDWQMTVAKDMTVSLYGSSNEVLLTNDFDIQAGSITANVYGGFFRARGATIDVTNGTPVINYYGGWFEVDAEGGGDVTETAYAGYFTAANADTNFAIYTDAGDIRLGGDTYWEGSGTGLAYGHMYVDGAQVIRVALTLNTPTEIKDDGTASVDDGWLSGDVHLVTFPTSGTEHYLTVTKAGVYLVNWNISFKMVTGAANTQIHAGLAVDSTTFIRNKCEAHRTISNNSDTGNAAGSCMVDLPNGNEEISLWMENTTNSNDADVSHGSITITQVGGT